MAGRKRQPVMPRVWAEQPLQATAAHWRLQQGEHPANAADDTLFSLPAFPERAFFDTCDQQSLPFVATTCGHNTMQDESYAAAVGVDAQVPISPLFVRDLAGRVIYTGYGKPAKPLQDWEQNRHVTFPRHCQDVTASVPGAEFIENVFFTRFRCLDISMTASFDAAGVDQNPVPAWYMNPHFYPYKLRPDTFYQDGWRLPQTEMVFARTVEEERVREAVQAFATAWEKRPEGQDYEAFYEAQSGDTWFEQLFLQGCTVIPTLEAANGFNKVGADFELQDFWPGRAVAGLHEVAKHIPNNAPAGTILQVIQPGYVTTRHIKPALVVVSDGSGYQTPHAHTPMPMIPDVRLPHPRTTSAWGATWLPTHPAHFETPALWGWEEKSGHFSQLSGPVWDPVHYFYQSTPKIIRACQHKLPENHHFSAVPVEMKRRFYPIVPMKTYDTFSQPTKQRRQEAGIALASVIDAVPVGQVCGVGYHPLPAVCEYELDPAWLPELHPQHRVNAAVPQEFETRLAAPIQSAVGAEQAWSTVALFQATPWLEQVHRDESMGWQKDYPQLQRYLSSGVPQDLADWLPLWLADVSDSTLLVNVKRLMGGESGRRALDNLQSGLADAVYQWREQNLAKRRLRHRLWQRYGGRYVALWLKGQALGQEKEMQPLKGWSDTSWKGVLRQALGQDWQKGDKVATQAQEKQPLEAA